MNYGRISWIKGNGALIFIFFFESRSVLYPICKKNPFYSRHCLAKYTSKLKLESCLRV